MSSDTFPPVIDPLESAPPLEGAAPLDGAAHLGQSEMEPAPGERRQDGERAQYKRSIYALPVSMQVVIGSARPTIAELLQMKDGTLLTLSSKIDDPVDLCINDRIIARGELVETDPATGAIGVRLTEIVDISEDILNA